MHIALIEQKVIKLYIHADFTGNVRREHYDPEHQPDCRTKPQEPEGKTDHHGSSQGRKRSVNHAHDDAVCAVKICLQPALTVSHT